MDIRSFLLSSGIFHGVSQSNKYFINISRTAVYITLRDEFVRNMAVYSYSRPCVGFENETYVVFDDITNKFVSDDGDDEYPVDASYIKNILVEVSLLITTQISLIHTTEINKIYELWKN